MKKLITLISTCALVLTFAGCTTSNDNQYAQNNQEMRSQCKKHDCKNKMHKHSNKVHSKIYTRNNQGQPSEIGYVKFYDADNGVKMIVNVDKLRDGVDYTTKIYQCTDAKCTNPDTCCMETTMAFEMPLTRQNKNNPVLQETFFIDNMTTGQLEGATIFFERDNGYRAAWGFLN